MRRRRRWPRRIAGVLGTAALLGSAAAIALMVLAAVEEEDAVPAAPAATPASESTKKKERKPRLTAAQRRARTAAAAVLTREGFEPVSLADYDPRAKLRVLIGRPGDDDAGDRRAFFFGGRDFIGNDSDTASTKLRVVGSTDRTVTLEYRLYEAGDERCCPKGGRKRVRFRWNGETLTPRGEIPAAAERVPATGA